MGSATSRFRGEGLPDRFGVLTNGTTSLAITQPERTNFIYSCSKYVTHRMFAHAVTHDELKNQTERPCVVTNSEWLASDDDSAMLEFVRPNSSERKLRLIAVACCRHLRLMLNDSVAAGAIDEAIGAAERYADGLGTKASLKRARQAVRAVRHGMSVVVGVASPAWNALWLTEVAASENACGSVIPEINRLAGMGLIALHERPPTCNLIRCVIGPPTRLNSTNRAACTSEVVSLARSIDELRSFERLPVLAQALETAGCDDRDVLSHCRTVDDHVRGCWVVDAVLGKQ